jgi:2-polyprenyl-3-methyl-5-hydroxy-6-metoxy-1,4-benzoquinol methylase
LIFPDPFPHPLDVQEMYGDPEKYFQRHHPFDNRAEFYRAMVREIQVRTGKSDPTIIDIGCGRGEMLRAAQIEGITSAIGLDLSEAMVAATAARGLVVFRRTAEDYAVEAGRTFDAVLLAAVAEHVENPDSLVRAARELCTPGGVLLVDVPREPNIVTTVGRLLAALHRSEGVLNLSPTFTPYHVYGFNPKALAVLLAKHGFRIEHLRVVAAPSVPYVNSRPDRLRAVAASLLIRVGNLTRFAPNMTAWARKVAG